MKGYEASNCRIVCVAANIAMNEWGVAVLRRLAQGVLDRDTALSLPRNRTIRATELSRSGSGLLRGITVKDYKGEPRYYVRAKLGGRMRQFGWHKDYECAVLQLEKLRSEEPKSFSQALGNRGNS